MSFSFVLGPTPSARITPRVSASLLRSGPSRRRQRSSFGVVACTANQKLIASSEIPLIFPREDFAQQLFRWAKIEGEANGLYNFGAPVNIQPIYKNPDQEEEGLWGFNAYVLRDGETVCQVGVWMDREKVEKHEFIGVGEDRFPTKEGRVTVVEGRELEIWKVGDHKMDDDTRNVVRQFCNALSEAIATYASFGSCFSDDAV